MSLMLMGSAERNRTIKMEYELLNNGDESSWVERPLLFGILDLNICLIAYCTISALGNLFMAISTLKGGLVPSGLYTVYAVMASVGFAAFALSIPYLIGVFAMFLFGSFVFGSFVSLGAMSIILNENVCQSVGRISNSPGLRSYCERNPERFQVMSVTIVLLELAAEVLMISLVRRMHHYRLYRSGKQSLGSIRIIE